jgi:ribose 5-phosphate isomerase A
MGGRVKKTLPPVMQTGWNVAGSPERPGHVEESILSAEQDRRKQMAADLAVQRIEEGMIVGLGTGSTADLVTRRLAERVAEGFQITGVPTSRRTAELASSLGIPLKDLQEVDHIDLTIDGADEIQPGTLFALKGAGGALLREKLVALDSSKVILVIDDTKIVDLIGNNFAVPVEVVQFGWRVPARGLEALGASIELRTDDETGETFVTDNDNYVLDAGFGAIGDPNQLSRRIKEITGVIEHGLFVGIVDEVIIAGDDGVQTMSVDAL